MKRKQQLQQEDQIITENPRMFLKEKPRKFLIPSMLKRKSALSREVSSEQVTSLHQPDWIQRCRLIDDGYKHSNWSGTLSLSHHADNHYPPTENLKVFWREDSTSDEDGDCSFRRCIGKDDEEEEEEENFQGIDPLKAANIYKFMTEDLTNEDPKNEWVGSLLEF